MAELIGSFAPIRLGETRVFQVKSGGLAKVRIRCFVRPPEPPEYRECPECGEIHDLESGGSFPVTASAETFLGRPGGIELIVVEPGVKQVRYELVLYLDRDSGSQKTVAT